MKTFLASLALLCASPLVSASTLVCNGSYWWIKFAARATTDDRTITSPVALKITGAPGGTKYWNLTPQTSAVNIGQSISFAATAPEGSGSLTSQYNGQYYVGNVTAATSFGSYNVPVKCTLTKEFKN